MAKHVPGYKVPTGVKPADMENVDELVDHLRRSFEAFVRDTSRKETGYMDAFMAVHNFHVLIVEDLIKRTGMPTGPAEVFRRMAVSTFEERMRREGMR